MTYFYNSITMFQPFFDQFIVSCISWKNKNFRPFRDANVPVVCTEEVSKVLRSFSNLKIEHSLTISIYILSKG